MEKWVGLKLKNYSYALPQQMLHLFKYKGTFRK